MTWKSQIREYCQILEIEPPDLILSKSELQELVKRKNWKKFINSFFTNNLSKETIRKIRKNFGVILERFWWNHACGTCITIPINGEKPITVICVKERFLEDKTVIKHETSHHFINITGVFDGECTDFIEYQAETLENIPVENWKNYIRLHC